MSALLATAFTPLAVLSAYLLWVATVSERTIAAGPFVSRPQVVQTDRDGEPIGRPLEHAARSTDSERDEA